MPHKLNDLSGLSNDRLNDPQDSYDPKEWIERVDGLIADPSVSASALGILESFGEQLADGKRLSPAQRETIEEIERRQQRRERRSRRW